MRLAKVMTGGASLDVVVSGDRYLPLPAEGGVATVERLAEAGPDGVEGVKAWLAGQPDGAWRPLRAVDGIGAPTDARAIYTIGENYRLAGEPSVERRARPLVYGKAAASLAGHRGALAWDRSLTPNVDAECELGVVIGGAAWRVDEAEAMDHVLGYTIVNDVSSRDPW